MPVSPFSFRLKKPFLKQKLVKQINPSLALHSLLVRSGRLKRKVKVDVYLPFPFRPYSKTYKCLLLNDGQDAEQLKLIDTLTEFYQNGEKFVVVAVHAGDRINEYGTAGQPDYKNRGWKAKSYSDFVIHKLLPYLRMHYGLFMQPEVSFVAGFSLGGLSAMDMLWKNPEVFSKVGVFSGSFWWRMKGLEHGYSDSDRIMHQIVEKGRYQKGLKFWFEAGTKDEEMDRNNNGIIDAIDDTLDLIKALLNKGYSNQDVTYLEIEGGEHNFNTWSQAFPKFLNWALVD